MVRYDKLVVNKLLDSYESSLLSTGENERTIHIEVKFTKTFLPAYFDESSKVYETIHIQMHQLEEEGLIQILWKDNKENHIIQKVRLKIDHLENAYAYAKRISKSELTRQNLEMLKEYCKQVDSAKFIVFRKFVLFLIERLEENKTVKEFIQLDDMNESRILLSAVRAVEQNDKSLYVREFSILNFQDSKVFEQLAGKVHHIFARFDDTYKNSDMAEWLAEHNIYQTPNFVYLKGNTKICVGNEGVDLSCFYHGLGISGEDIDRIEMLKNAKVNKIITIENLTTYFRWQEGDSLIVYLGGYHNAVRRNLLQKIYESFPDARYYHFGDIDAGGFEIYKDLCSKTGIPFEMYLMDLKILMKYESFGKKLTQNDRKRLENMLVNAKKSEKDLIVYMLEHDVKLEQECVALEEGCKKDLILRKTSK